MGFVCVAPSKGLSLCSLVVTSIVDYSGFSLIGRVMQCLIRALIHILLLLYFVLSSEHRIMYIYNKTSFQTIPLEVDIVLLCALPSKEQKKVDKMSI